MTYSFDTGIAAIYGVDEAIVLQNIVFWVAKNKANGSNQHDGKTWTYNSVHAFRQLFPFWTEKQISRVLKSLIDQGLLLTGNYNKSAYDRTLWYALVDESIAGIGKIDLPKRGNGDAQTVEPIPDSKPDSLPDTKTHIEAPDVSVGVLESIKHPSNLPKLIYDKWQAIPGVTKDCDYMYWIQREYRDIARAIEGFHSDIVLASLDNYRIERNNPNTRMTAKVSSRQFFTGGLFETCRGATDAKKLVKRCPACTCELLPEGNANAGKCGNPECERYHQEVV